MLKEEVPLLNTQIKALEELNVTYVTQDSLRVKEIQLYKNAYEDQIYKYNKLNSRYKTCKVLSVIGGIASFLLGALCL